MTRRKVKIFAYCKKDLRLGGKLYFKSGKLYEVVREEFYNENNKLSFLNEFNHRHYVTKKCLNGKKGWLKHFIIKRRVLIEKTGYYI